jgi:apolipoprotein N-acyltransferase
VICFEAVFPDLVRRFVARGSQVIFNLTNDGWYGISNAPYQHLEIARMRAVENRRYFLRAANTGFSAVIEPTGRIAASTGFDEEAICLGRFGFIEEKTFYSRYGNVFVWLCAVILASEMIYRACVVFLT